MTEAAVTALREEMEKMKTEMFAALAEKDQKIKSLEEKAMEAMAEAKAAKVSVKESEGALREAILYGERDKHGNRDVTNERGFGQLPVYGGGVEEFEDWHFSMTTFLNKHDGFKSVIAWVEGRTEEPKLEEYVKWAEKQDGGLDHEKLNFQLFDVLSMNVKGKALKMIKKLVDEKGVNGVAGWWKL